MAKKVRAKKARREREVARPEPEVHEDEGPQGDPMLTALVLLTTVCLIIAIGITWWQLGRDYNAGLFGS